jgi:hypothetical protein
MKDGRYVLLAAALAVPGLMAISCCGGCVLLLSTRTAPRPIADGDVDLELVSESKGDVSPQLVSDDADAQQRAQFIEQLRADLRVKVQEAVASEKTVLAPSAMQRGDVGTFAAPIRIFQVVGEQRFLAHVGSRDIVVLFHIRDVGEDLVDDRLWPVNGRWFAVLGPTTYTTAVGGTKTVMEVIEIDGPR